MSPQFSTQSPACAWQCDEVPHSAASMALHVSMQPPLCVWQYALLLHSVASKSSQFSTHADGLPCV
jgi:hypothetical protein